MDNPIITKQAQINGTAYDILPNCEKSYSYTYKGKAKHALANGNGTYRIPGIKDAKNANLFYAMDTGLVLMYDEEDGVWWEQ